MKIIIVEPGSFLASVHHKMSLGAVLSHFLQKRASEAARKHTQAAFREAPADMLIQGFFQACQDQTADYDWFRILDAVRDTCALGTDASYACLLSF